MRTFVFTLAVMMMICFSCGSALCEADLPVIVEQNDDDQNLAEINPEPQPPKVDPAKVEYIEIHLTDGRAYKFTVPVDLFDMTILDFLGFIDEDSDSSSFIIYDRTDIGDDPLIENP